MVPHLHVLFLYYEGPEMNPRIKFSHIWDKLNDPEFTTIRRWNPEKERYYEQQVGKLFTVLHQVKQWHASNGSLICYSYLRNIELIPGQLIPDAILLKDVTLNGVPQMDWYAKIRKMDKAILLHFSRSPDSQLTLNVDVANIEEALK